MSSPEQAPLNDVAGFDADLTAAALQIADALAGHTEATKTALYLAGASLFGDRLAEIGFPKWLVRSILNELSDRTSAELDRIEGAASYLSTAEPEGNA